MSSMRKAKKQRMVYKEDAARKAEELEEFLFGVRSDPLSILNRTEKDDKDSVAELVKEAGRGEGLIHNADVFFEDKSGAADISSDEDEADVEDTKGRRDGGSDSEGSSAEKQADGGALSSSEVGLDDGDEEAAADKGAPTATVCSSAGAGTAGRQQQRQEGREAPQGGPRVPVWQDPHDAEVRVDVAKQARLRKLRASDKQTTMGGAEYEAALRRQHEALNPRTSWARKRQGVAEARVGRDTDVEDEGAEGATLLGCAGGLTERAGSGMGALPAGQLETTRLRDANQHQPSGAVVQAVRFHPNGQVFLTAGLDKTLRLFQVDGVRNELLQGLHLDDLPITDAAFASSGGAAAGVSSGANRVVLAGRRPFLYLFDMDAARVERVPGPTGMGAAAGRLRSLESFTVAPPGCSPTSEPLVAFAGDAGFLPLLSLRSRQWVGNLKMSGNVRALAFTHDGTELWSTGDDALVHVWDLRTGRCRLVFSDLGNIRDASSLALSPDGRYVATGSCSGVVNVYRRGELEEAAARATSGAVAGAGPGRVTLAPARELMNLTTNVDTLTFSPDSQMLAMASRMKQNSLRLVHLPSLTVFSNWPTARSPLHYVHSLDFSPHCGLLAVGNAKGRALLYRLHHYEQA